MKIKDSNCNNVYTSVLLYKGIKQSSLKILRYLFLLRFDCFDVKQKYFPQSRMAAFQTFDKMNNLDQICCLMTLPERKN